jgi:predicted RNA-binding protein with PUA-like domain
MKSEPNVFSFTDLQNKPVEEWHSVRNFTARNNMMQMKVGDRAFFYHSNIGKEIVGIMQVVAEAHPDSTAEPNAKGQIVWQCVDVAADRPFRTPVTLQQIKADPALQDMALLKYSRLSVQPVTAAEWQHICKLGGL